MSVLPTEDPEPDPAISALEEAMRQALAAASRERVVSIIASGLLVETEAEPGPRPTDAGPGGKFQKVSVSMPAELLELVRARVGPGEFSRYVTEAVQARIQHDLLGDLLDELESEHGPVPEEVREQTRQMWPDQSDE
jgi:Arc/MetJ-type ribon-helix-helix transcriptional regulator